MARHKIESLEKGNQPGRHRSGSRFGVKILSAARRSAQNVAEDERTEEAARFWSSAAAEVNQYNERTKRLKGMYIEGLQRLVQAGAYDPRVTRRLSHINVLTSIVEGQDDPYLKHAHAYVDVHGRFIAANAGTKEGVYVHEFAHKTLQIGAPDKTGKNMVGWSLYDEPIAERVRSDFNLVMEIDNDIEPTYQAHTRVMNKVLGATGLTFHDVTRIASGDDPVENYEQFRSEAMINTGGVDIVGWSQQSYANYTAFYKRQHQDATHLDAIYYAADMVEQDLDGYLSPSAAVYA
jgi:hypothetical protein